MKRLLCFTLLISMLLSFSVFNVWAKEYSFDDMADFLSKMDILHGDASKGGDYDFYSYLTRAQFAKIAVMASPYKNSVPVGTNTSPYSDVSREHWAAGYIKVAATNRIVTGYPDSTFRPEATVLLEEAVTIMLKLLGYENADFGGEWPYGQMGIASNLGLLDNVSATVGNPMTRIDAIALVYNTLNENTKNGNSYLQTLGYQLYEEVVLISSSYENSNIDSDKVVTSNGTYKVSKNFDFSKVGSKGDMLLKNNKEIAGFFADGKSKETYVVMGVLSEDIIVKKGAQSEVLDLTDDTEAYYNNTKITASSLSQRVKAGDSISVIKDNNNNVKYVIVDNKSMEGPLRVTSTNFLSSLSMNASDVTIIKGGNVVTLSDISINDIIYYSKALNTVWAYSDKRVGIYENALPNQETPTQVVISGNTYELESAEAFSKLSSTGTVKLGQTVTVLLGKDGKIADVLTNGVNSDEIYGYALETGSKEYTLNTEKYLSYYIKIATPDGNTHEYETDKEYSGLRGKVVKISFSDSYAKPVVVSGGGASGVFNYSGGNFGSQKLSSIVSVIDVKEITVSENGEFIKVYPLRINGVNIKSDDVLYVNKNANGEITELILKEVTGDTYQYGMIVSANERGGTTYLSNGAEKSTGTFFTVKPKTFVRLDLRGSQLSGVHAINSVGNVKELTATYVKDSNGKIYTISDSVQVYTVDYNFNYNLSTLTEAVTNSSKYSISAYYDKEDSEGGRVRIIILR